MKQFSQRTAKLGAGAVMALTLAACGGGDSSSPYQPPSLSDGVIFTYPIDGQTDVHLGTRFYVTFSKNASQSAVNASCSVSGGEVSGNFCLIGPGDQVVSIAPTVSGKVVQFETDQLQQGTRYELYVRSAVIGGGSTNLPSSSPLVTFLTSRIDPIDGAAPTIIAINGEDPDVYSTVVPSPPEARYPMMDFSTIRVEFSEPLDEKTVQAGASFEFVEVDGASEIPVAGAMVVRQRHVSFDPDEDLTPGTTYRLRMGAGILDLNGDALNAVTYEMVPEDADRCGCVITQRFNTTAAYGEAGFPQTSRLTGRPLNAIDLYSPLIGSNDLNLRDITLEARLADPSAFGGLIPFVIRKGTYLNITGLDLALGGEVPANLQTGDITASFVTDVTGYMDRNPYRAYNTPVDDRKSPVFVYLIFDMALTGSDPTGNAVLNQTIPHVQATGTAYINNGTLFIESVRTLEMDLMGLDRTPAHMVLGIQSDLVSSPVADTTAPTIPSAYPSDGAEDFPIGDEISLIFSEPMDNAGVVPQDQVTLTNVTDGNVAVPFQITWDGSTLLLKPESPLLNNKTYDIGLGALTDLAGNGLQLDGSDATGGDGTLSFSTENPVATTVGPMATSVFPGIPCTLTDADADNVGRCAGGSGSDQKYVPPTLATDGRIEVVFTQPMNQSTLSLGSACGSGAVRVEELDSGGACVGVVDGSLIADTRGFTFTPVNGWTEGTEYRLTLASGNNTACEAGDLCSTNNVPLNPDPLNGGQAGDAGGANIVNTFTAVAPNNDVLLPLTMQPVTDTNGNGYRDGAETARLENSAGVSVTGVGGIVVGALIDGDSNIYLSGALPVTVGEVEPLTVDGTPWGMTIAGDSQIPITVHPGILYGTSIRLDTTANVVFNIPINDVDTGLSILRPRQTGDTPIVGYIVEEAGEDQPQFIAQLDLYMDAPDMVIEVLGVISVSHDLTSKPISVNVKGPVAFLDDGRILITPESVSVVDLVVNVSSLGLPGSISLQIPAGSMQMSLIGNPIKGRK